MAPNAIESLNTTRPPPSRTTTCAPPPAAVSSTSTGAASSPPLVRPAEPLARLGVAGVTDGGSSITSRAIDQTRTTVITAATRTDQLGPPRVPRSGPPRPVASSASKTRRGSTGASAYRSA